jgi:photosystem II stability/assembly factor-like uncharacterized protein
MFLRFSPRPRLLGARWGAASRAALAAALLPGALGAQGGARGDALLPHDSVLVRTLAFRDIGPASMSGRIVDLSVVENPPGLRGPRLGTTMYAGVATGGVWKSTNGGITWGPISDALPVGSIGAVAAAPSNGNVVWVGSGEANNMRSSSWGVGVFKTTDGGRSWSKAMLPGSQHIGRIAIDPRDPDVVYVAAMGPLWAPGGERGLYKTTDGGATWTAAKTISPQTGFTEVVLDPANPDIVYAAALQRERREYGFLPGGPESGIWKSTDAGTSWTKLAGGLPTGEVGRIGLSVCRSRPATLYAAVHAKGAANGYYRSDDAGATWRQVNAQNPTAWYYSQVRCDPTDAERVYRLNAASQQSSDGGKTWQPFANGGGVHSDAHALWINPEAPDHLVLGGDGGMDISHDRGRTWHNVENIVGAQFYAIATDDRWPFYHVYGGLQDNQTWGGPNRTRTPYGPSNADWYRMFGGDGFYNVPDPFDPNTVYAEMQEGGVVRYDALTGQTISIKPIPAAGERHRYNWSAPIVPSRHTRGVVYFAANHLFRSADRGDSWRTISPDLTRNLDRDALPLRGAVPAKDALGRNEGTAQFSNIATVSESPRRAGLLAVGTNDGLIQVTRNDGASWSRTAAFPGVPDTTFVSRVQWSQHAEGTLYATFDGHRSNDFRPYVYKSTDYGASWQAITGDLPAGGSVHVIREHHRQPDLLFVGTEFGAFFTVDGGAHWVPLRSGIPTVPVWDLQLQARWNDLVLGTHGRGVFILDDLTPLEELAAARRTAAAGAVHLFGTRPEIALALNASRESGMGSAGYTGKNPEHGVRLAYLLPRQAEGTRVTMEIQDARGRVIRQLAVPQGMGLHRPVWDMRVGAPLTGPVDTTAMAGGRGPGGGMGGGGGGGGGGFGGFNRGAPQFLAAPGRYTARLTVTPKEGAPVVRTTGITLLPDPEQRLSAGTLATLNDFRVQVAALQRRASTTQVQADSAARQVTAFRQAVQKDSAKVPAATRQQLVAQLARTDSALGAVQRALGPAGPRRPPTMEEEDNGGAVPTGAPFSARLQQLAGVLNATFPVTPARRSALQALTGELDGQARAVAAVRATQLPALKGALQAAGVTVP